MISFAKTISWLVIAFALAALPHSLRAQAPSNPAPILSTNSVRATHLLPKPILKSPVALFRELLAMNLVEQMQYLTNRSPEDRKLILAKLREYKSMKPDQRELRLRVTELRWYLLPLMRTPAINRGARLGMIPAEQRELIEARLKEWDNLPTELQKELLDNEAAINRLTELEASTSSGRPPGHRAFPDPGLAKWKLLSDEQRQNIMGRFNQFFELNPREKEKALSTVSEPERRQMEKTLRKFGDLDPVRRAVCMKSFEKFADLTMEERQQFLKNAQRWELMTPEERQTWRDLVTRISVSPVSSSSFFKLPRPPRPSLQTPTVAGTNN